MPTVSSNDFTQSMSWQLPELESVLFRYKHKTESDEHVRAIGGIISQTLEDFGLPIEFRGAYRASSATKFLFLRNHNRPVISNRKNRIVVQDIHEIENDITLAIASPKIIIEAPIPGTNYIGITVPNPHPNVVSLREAIQSSTFANTEKTNLNFVIGEDMMGSFVVEALNEMPNLLISGARLSGVSSLLSSILACLLCTQTPNNLRLILIDPQMSDFGVFNGIPHLLNKVATTTSGARDSLTFMIHEMKKRLHLFYSTGVRTIHQYNLIAKRNKSATLPYFVMAISDISGFAISGDREIGELLFELSRWSNGTGIHLLVATHNGSEKVLPARTRDNFPSRISLMVKSAAESKIMIGSEDALKLFGAGFLLFRRANADTSVHLQAPYVSYQELERIVHFWKTAREEVRDSEAGISKE